MRADKIENGKLYVRKDDDFRYIIPYNLYAGCEHRLPGREIQYLNLSRWMLKENGVHVNDFPCKFSTFQAWADREATDEEYALFKPVIDKALQKLEQQAEANQAEERELAKKQNEWIEQTVLQNVSTEKLEAELKRRYMDPEYKL